MALPTNLAPRPFRNERLPWLVAGAVVVLAVLTSVAHVQWISRLISGGEARTVRLVLEDEARIAELETALALEPPLKLEAAEIARLAAFKQLVDRRVFPWRRLLAEFEDLLAADVRLTRISPMAGERGQGMLISVFGEARSKGAAFSFAEALHAAPAFSNAILRSLSEDDNLVTFSLEVVFDPLPTPLVPRPEAAP